MEKQKASLVFVLVLNFLSWGQTLHRIGAIGCSVHIHLCKTDEDCDKEAVYPLGQCKKSLFTKRAEYVNNKRFRHSQVGEIEGHGGNIGEVEGHSGNIGEVTSSDEQRERNKIKDASGPDLWTSDEDESYENGKYDITYFEKPDSFIETPRKEHGPLDNNKLQRLNSEDNHDNVQRKQYDAKKNENYVSQDSLHHAEGKKNFKHEGSKDERWPPIGPLEHVKHDELAKPQHSKFDDQVITNNKRTSDFVTVNEKPGDDNSLDLDIEIKPLSLSDAKYFDKEKTKHSSIPNRPTATESETPQQIEHIQTNFIDTAPEKKARIDVLIGGQLNQAKADIVLKKSPDKTYDKVKDFFKSQQVSSLVDAPVAEKKGSVKFHSFMSQDKGVHVKRSSIPTPSVYPDGIRLNLKERLNLDKANDLLDSLRDLLWGPNGRRDRFTFVETDDNVVLFYMLNNTTTNRGQPSSVVERINHDDSLKNALGKAVGVTVLSASLQSDKTRHTVDENSNFMIITLIVAGCVTAILLASVCIFIILKRSQDNTKWIPKQAGHEAASDYQSLWRQLRQATWEGPVRTAPVVHAGSEYQKAYFGNKGMPSKYSWSEEPVDTKMDISTGHVVLAYLEDHLKDENRLSREWEELNVYIAEPDNTDVGRDPNNSKKNRYSDVLPYDHNRVKLRETSNATGSDYINASYIIDDHPRNPAYIATQGPLGSTVTDFWQMIWEQGVVVIVMLTKLADLGLPQCSRYWPDKGHEVYHIYQVNLISEHIWCSDYLVRSFYLKNVQTGETRTVTQFHFLTWPHLGIPISSKPLLEFRRKVLKCFRNQPSPIVVHCSGGIDRTGTYILLDMVLRKMSKGTKEIDIAATLEHLRDQRPDIVKTKAQFEFALRSVADEVNAILQVLTKH